MVGYSHGDEGRGFWQAVYEAGSSHSSIDVLECTDEPAVEAGVAFPLSRIIETEIIPRLLLAHTIAPVPAEALPDGSELSADRVVAFTRLVRLGQDVEVSAQIAAYRADGETIEGLFMDLLAPCAKLLGELWSADICDFVEVTVALSRLQRLMTELGPDFIGEGHWRSPGRRILLLPTPGEQHTFGLSMVEKFFRRAGWDVSGGGGGPSQDLESVLRRESFGIVGLSLSGAAQLGSLVSTIRSIRRMSCNKAVRIIVGGPVFVERPELGVLVGADATAANGPAAVLVAESLVDMRARVC